MPFFKPRLQLDSDDLSILPVPPKEAYDSIFDDPDILGKLRRTDGYYREFSGFKRVGLMPFSWGMSYLYGKLRTLIRLVQGDEEGMPLLKKLMSQMVLEARERDAVVIFVALPDKKTVRPNFWRKYLPDLYGKMVENLKKEGYDLLDTRPALRRRGTLGDEMFYDDGIHYSSAGNRVIAAELKAKIENLK
jgi:hypothetical protein